MFAVFLLALALGQTPSGRPVEKPRVLVLDLEVNDISPTQARLINGLLTESMSRFDGFDVVSTADLRQLVSVEAQKSAAGCDASSCLAEVADALGARYVVFGNVGQLGTLTILTLSLFDANRAAAVGRQRAQVAHIEELPAAIDAALVALVGQPQRGSAPAPKAPAPKAPDPTATVNPPLTPAAQSISWSQNATAWRGQNAKVFVVDCPAGQGGTVYGGPTYTDDSSICASAVHAGSITHSGGRVTLQIAAGLSSYPSSTRNGITTTAWDKPWQGSFVVTGANVGANVGSGPPAPSTISWSTTATSWRGQNGSRIEVVCPANGVVGTVYGGDPSYTDDSSICTAAVHAGRVTLAQGGRVVIEVAPGRQRFESTTSNGVTTRPWDRPWEGTFFLR